jgi:hypothetical protein
MRRLLRLLMVLAALISWLSNTPSALAVDVSTDDFTRLVAEAVESAHFESLADVTSINGQLVDISRILDGTPADVKNRLTTLRQVGEDQEGPLDAETLRAQADEIVSNPPYAAEAASGVGVLARIARFVENALSNSATRGLGLIVLLGFVFLAGFLILDRLVDRPIHVGQASPLTVAGVDYRSQAEAAAASGDFSGAVRLLFIDGSHLLEGLNVVRHAGVTSSATVRPLTEDHDFLDRFDEIAYGGAEAHGEDVTQARDSWDALGKRLQKQ